MTIVHIAASPPTARLRSPAASTTIWESPITVSSAAVCKMT